MSILNTTASSNEPESGRTPTPSALSDIAVVAIVSASAFLLEGYAIDRGWLAIGDDARGASAVILGALAAVGVTLARGKSLTALGFKRPRSWRIVPLQVLAILAAFVVLQALVPMVASVFIDVPTPDLSRHSDVAGNLSAALFMALVLPLTASIPEEVIYRGFLIERLISVFGETRGGTWLAVIVQSCIFGAIHFQWGIGGMVMTVVMGFVWGTAYLLCDRNLWVVILAHSGGHLLLVTQLYLAEPVIF